MAGYIMTISNYESLKKCIETGIYSTNMSSPQNGKWRTAQEGTFADYFSMQKGDSIYFFYKRKIYGRGELVNLKGDCKFLNFKGADDARTYLNEDNREYVVEDSTIENKCFCTFVPSPFFFENSVDMDDALSSNPQSFKMLRTMWKVSFIKIDDEEDKALQSIILKRNEENLIAVKNTFRYVSTYHEKIKDKIDEWYRLNSFQLLTNARDGDKSRHEMAIEAALCGMLGKQNSTPFGKWDYISHQVAASPFKPVDYMDKMDHNAHSVYLMYYHLIMVVKYRRKVIDDPISERAKEIWERIAPDYGITLEEWNHDVDHVHVMFRAQPKSELSKFINAYKSASSRLLKKEYPQIRERLWKEAFWSQSFCLLTAGGAPIDVIRSYIETQGEKKR